MISQEAQDLLTQRNNAIIAVSRPSGGPQVTPVWYLWDGEAFYFSITRDRAKYSNIKRNPSISLIVDNNSKGPGYVAAYGVAQIIEHDFADVATRLIAKYVSSEQMEQMTKVVLAPERIVIKLVPEKVVTPGVN